jgi:hypothetical protein
MPEYAFGTEARRVLIGERYILPDHDGVDRPALVTAATVQEAESVAYCGVTFDDGRSAICTMPLSTGELAAWKQHRDTFFGVVGQRSTHANSTLEFYDFFHESYKCESKERLLEVMANAHDFEQLRSLDQPQLASIHAERMTRVALAAGACDAKVSPHAEPSATTA